VGKVPMNEHLRTAAIEVLNELLKANPRAVNDLLAHRVEVGKSVIDHPDVVVAVADSGKYTGRLGLLGVINGILSRTGALRVAMQIDEAGCVVGFCRYGIDGG
jgi:hypothetical protein